MIPDTADYEWVAAAARAEYPAITWTLCQFYGGTIALRAEGPTKHAKSVYVNNITSAAPFDVNQLNRKRGEEWALAARRALAHAVMPTEDEAPSSGMLPLTDQTLVERLIEASSREGDVIDNLDGTATIRVDWLTRLVRAAAEDCAVVADDFTDVYPDGKSIAGNAIRQRFA